MVNLRGRLIPVLVAQKPRTIADVGIFQISEMFFVKKSGLFQKFPAVDCCSGAGRKNPVGRFKFTDRFSFSSCECPSQHIIVISRIVDFITLLIGNQLCAACKRILSFTDSLIKALDKVREHFGVVV